MKWISVKDRLPKFKQDAKYLVSDGTNVFIALYALSNDDPAILNAWVVPGIKCFDVTHWMPLPKLPKEK